ncbi:MAG: aminopeptidase [Proteobacteria bacterium]|nr:aminopeptidase [Pseudomonadota bacterium]
MKDFSKKEIENIKTLTENKQTLIWDSLNRKEKESVFMFSDAYKDFLSRCKTEREAVLYMIDKAKQYGFVDLDSEQSPHGKYYKVYRDKVVALTIFGKESFDKGFRIIGSHIDSPRLDLKQNPLYEEVDLALMKTHYYGGIKKYHWLARPLSMHGSVVTKGGKRIDIVLGEKESEPVFTISDLLPHLSKTQTGKKLSEAFDGEKLNILVGSLPIGDDKVKERFKLAVLKELYDHYQITEGDFISAEIELVPAGSARDVGFDRSLIGAYGQDDRICAFTSFEALLETKKPEHTAVGLFFDKEEIGSEGSTGAKSRFFEDFISDVIEKQEGQSTERMLRKSLIQSQMLSADVNAALEPDYQEVHDKKNAARLGYGICVTKFTGTGGKSGSSDASAEYMGVIRDLFDKNNIVWQTGELGKVDQGGGGTIAKFLASYGMEIVDCGPALLSMHSPFEIASKADIYMTFKAYAAFFK